MRRTLHRTVRRLAASAAFVLLSTTAMTVVTESPALAVSCAGPSSHPNGGGGYNVAETTTLYTGPYSACSKVGSLNTQQYLWAWCFWPNDYGNTWWYVRVGGTSTYGWVYPGGTLAWFETRDSSGQVESPVACDPS